VDIIPREGKPALFSIWTLRPTESIGDAYTTSALVIRDAHGNRTQDAARLRAFSGFAPT
jgi:hypothetical protein